MGRPDWNLGSAEKEPQWKVAMQTQPPASNPRHARPRSCPGLRAVLKLTLALMAASSLARPGDELLGRNLLANGDAEAGPGSNDGSQVAAIPGWTVEGDFTVVQYGAEDWFTYYPALTDPGPEDRGRNFFAGGPGNALSRAVQLVDVSGLSETVDAGEVAFGLGGYLGGWEDQDDHATLSITFLGAAQEPLGTVVSLGGVLAADRGHATGLLERTAEGLVPAETRTIRVELEMVREGGLFNSYNDGYADSLGLVLFDRSPGEPEVYVDVYAGWRRIAPEIYGMSHATQEMLESLNLTVNRFGGNHTSRHNWTINAANRGSDYFFESLRLSDQPADYTYGKFINETLAAGADAMVTVPTIGWVAKLEEGGATWSFDKETYASQGPQTKYDPQHSQAGNGVLEVNEQGDPTRFVVNNDRNDANVPSVASRSMAGLAATAAESVSQEEWLQAILSRNGSAGDGGVRYYILDNEYGLWHKTHRDVHPTPVKRAEMEDRMLAYAEMIRGVDSEAVIVGPEAEGWEGCLYSGDAQAWAADNEWNWAEARDNEDYGNVPLLAWLLDTFKERQRATGQRLLDVLSVHFYPRDGVFVHEHDKDDPDDPELKPEAQRKRNRATRTLWDPDYDTFLAPDWQPRIRLLPQLREWADACLGTRIALTEYNWGAEGHMSGATAQADVLGILGREGVDLASWWPSHVWRVPYQYDLEAPVFGAFRIYRNYDGANSTFGELSVSAQVPDPLVSGEDLTDWLAAFAAWREDDALTVMVVAKDLEQAQRLTLRLETFADTGAIEWWELHAANQDKTRASLERRWSGRFEGGHFTPPDGLQLPPQSVALFVITRDEPPLAFVVRGPVDLIVTDRAGKVTSHEVTDIPDSRYVAYDKNQSREPGDTVVIYRPAEGQYQVLVVPEVRSPQRRTVLTEESEALYSLYVCGGSGLIPLAEQQPVEDLNGEPVLVSYRSGHVEPPQGPSEIRLSGATRLEDGRFKFKVTAPAARFVQLEASADLADWTAIETVCTAGEPLDVMRRETGEPPGRFYRVLAW